MDKLQLYKEYYPKNIYNYASKLMSLFDEDYEFTKNNDIHKYDYENVSNGDFVKIYIDEGYHRPFFQNYYGIIVEKVDNYIYNDKNAYNIYAYYENSIKYIDFDYSGFLHYLPKETVINNININNEIIESKIKSQKNITETIIKKSTNIQINYI